MDSHIKETMKVRVVYVRRNGFRRRRLVTSLLDPVAYPASEHRLLVDYCARHRIVVRPGRVFPREKQEYRRKSRGLIRGKVGRPRKPTPKFKRQDRRFATDSKGNTYLKS